MCVLKKIKYPYPPFPPMERYWKLQGGVGFQRPKSTKLKCRKAQTDIFWNSTILLILYRSYLTPCIVQQKTPSTISAC